MKLPYSKVPRFIELPKHGKNYYLMFIEDIIKANIDTIFPGYDVDSSYCIKISRDADILIDESANTSEIIEQVKSKVKKRKIGAVCRFVYDRAMPDDFLDFLVDASASTARNWFRATNTSIWKTCGICPIRTMPCAPSASLSP